MWGLAVAIILYMNILGYRDFFSKEFYREIIFLGAVGYMDALIAGGCVSIGSYRIDKTPENTNLYYVVGIIGSLFVVSYFL